jgi:6-phosphogluconolactonase/glucosamine-6-phosphate isomerase/deaminase
VLAEAGLVLVMVAGSGKSEIVARVLGDKVDVQQWPAQSARSANAVWLLDSAAAAQWSKNR